MADAVGVNVMARAGLGWTAWRRFLASGVALAFIAGFVGSADAARYSRTQTASKKREPAKLPFGELPKGPLQMVVSIGGQHVTLYANGQRIEQARVSTGTVALHGRSSVRSRAPACPSSTRACRCRGAW